jgi:flagellar basal body rod protein FlgF
MKAGGEIEQGAPEESMIAHEKKSKHFAGRPIRERRDLMDLKAIGLEGLQQAETKLERVARRRAAAEGDLVQLSEDALAMIEARNQFEASLKLIATANELDQHTINLLG